MIMWLLKILIFVVLLAALVFVGLKNSTPVPLDLFGYQLTEVPLYLALFGAAIVGLLLGLGFAGVREIQWRVALSRQRRESSEAERELQGLRMASLDEEPRSPGDSAEDQTF
jgi:uncharacterized integral membrane protein